MAHVEYCPCGRQLHYTDKAIEAKVKALIKEKGRTVEVTVGAETWRVPRHYIALHGLRAKDLSYLGYNYGWERIRPRIRRDQINGPSN